MSKELEAFNRVWEDCSKLDLDYVSKHNLMDDLREIKQTLTPPTAEEVCKALSERYNNAGIQHLKHNKSFVYGYMLKPICWLKEDGTIYWGTNDLTPHLIILIGRFYEGVIHEQK